VNPHDPADDTPVLGRRRVNIESEVPEPRHDPETGQLRLRLRGEIERSEKASPSPITTGAWDAIARSLDLVRSPRPVVLIVEDDPPTRWGYIHGLEDECECIPCGNVEEAKNVIDAASRLDLVILDMGLPDGSGYDVASHLRMTARFAREPDVLVISAYVNENIKKLFSRLPGPTYWISKVDKGVVDAIKSRLRRTPPVGTAVVKDPEDKK
jgi:CheY-like chemotaxis protein